MLDLNRLQPQFADFNAYQSREQAMLQAKRARALDVLEDCNAVWPELRDRVRTARLPWLVPYLREAPAGTARCGPRPTPITVVATDGSQVFPDRHVEPTCYLLNISRIAFQYGTHERPLMEAVPEFRYRSEELEDHFDDLIETATAEVVSAIRDERELEALLDTARTSRLGERPLVALADGTLILWMLRRMQNRALEDSLIKRYAQILDAFQQEQIPLCSYISMPGNTEVVNLLRVHLGEADDVPPPAEESLAGLPDRMLFEKTLAPGERSAIFESASHIQTAYGDVNKICYFYIHIVSRGASEIGRVEIPSWLADRAELVDMIHAVVLSECEKGDGYPMILSEAHERAVIRAHEKSLFYEMVERQMRASGLSYSASRKQASKRRPML